MAKRGENIYHRKDGRWEARYVASRREDGSARYRSVYAKTYQAVKEKLEKCKAERFTGQEFVCNLTVKMLCVQWLEHTRSIVKASSYALYERQIKRHILPALGHLRADRLTAYTFSRFINDKLTHGRLDGKGGLSTRTVQELAILVKSIMRLAWQTYRLPDQLAVVKPPKTEHPEIQVLSGEELCRLEKALQAMPDNPSAGILTCLYTGLRLGEICALRWSDIDLENGILHVRGTVQRLPQQNGDGAKTRLVLTMPKTQKAVREIPLPPALRRCLQKLAAGQDSKVFLSTGTTRFADPRTYQYRFRRLLETLEIRRVPFHGLRHTFATQCIRRGMDTKSLSEILGHATVEMTLNRYVHSSLETKRLQMETLDFSEPQPVRRQNSGLSAPGNS